MDIRTLRALVAMLSSGDEGERKVASRGLERAPAEDIVHHLSDSDLPLEVMEYFARNSSIRSEWVEALRANPSLPDSLRHEIERAPSPHSGPEKNEAAAQGHSVGGTVSDEKLSLAQEIQQLTVGEKIKMALKGDKEARTILLKDTNRQIYMSVLENPGLKESEVEMLTRNTSTNADILRAIGKNREWTSNKNIVKNLVLNSKTPVEVSMRFLPRMSLKDLEFIDKSRNLPSAVRLSARRLILHKKKGR
ncbi:MAG: hypothetical protein JSV26_11060 [bacterium]|nr:MAG: hypothetical protein JSV26_11060 [bacterium]